MLFAVAIAKSRKISVYLPSFHCTPLACPLHTSVTVLKLTLAYECQLLRLLASQYTSVATWLFSCHAKNAQ